MTQFYIVEIQKGTEYAHNVFWAYDADPRMARLKAESKYHEILSAAAISEYDTHAAILFSAEGEPLMHECYYHNTTPEETEE